MTLGTTKTQLAELEMLRKDLVFYYEIAQASRSSSAFGTLMLGLMPYLSLFTIETQNLLSKRVPDYAKQLKLRNESLIRISRTKIKMFEEYDILDLLEWIAEYQKMWFIGKHNGFLEWLKRPLRTDLGLYYYGSHLICTTHIAYSNIGLKEDKSNPLDKSLMGNISSTSKAFGEDIGRYIGQLYSDFIASQGVAPECQYSYSLDDSAIDSKDVKSAIYLERVFNGPASPQVNSCLVLFLANVNFVHHIMRSLSVDTSDTYFKLKYITLYQLIISIGNLRNYFYPKGFLTENSKNHINDILDDKDLQKIKSQKNLRNILVHYTIENVPENKIDVKARLCGLIEHFFPEYSIEDLSDLLDRQMRRISAILENWLIYTK